MGGGLAGWTVNLDSFALFALLRHLTSNMYPDEAGVKVYNVYYRVSSAARVSPDSRKWSSL